MMHCLFILVIVVEVVVLEPLDQEAQDLPEDMMDILYFGHNQDIDQVPVER